MAESLLPVHATLYLPHCSNLQLHVMAKGMEKCVAIGEIACAAT